MLSRFGLLLAVDNRNIGDVDVDEVILASLMPKLSECFNKGHALDITNSATLLDRRLETGNLGSRAYWEENWPARVELCMI